MHLLLLTVGRTKENFFQEAVLYYRQAIARTNEIEVLELKDHASDPDREAEAIQSALERRKLIGKGSRAQLVLLEETGKKFDSLEFSNQLQRWKDSSLQHVVFLLGGAFGFPRKFVAELPNPATMSLSALTFPHELARILLLEQIYRALHIQAGSKYHHS